MSFSKETCALGAMAVLLAACGVESPDDNNVEGALSSNLTAQAGTNNAGFVSQSVPTSMKAGQSYAVSVTMKNTGTSVWTDASNDRLGSQNPQDNKTWGLGRVRLSASDSIHPGQSKTFNFAVTAPTSAGVYNFQWRMLEEGVMWFGQSSPNVQIAVSGGSGALDVMNWYISKHPTQALTGTHPSSQTVSGNDVYFVKWASNAYEHHQFDSQHIYLREDHSLSPRPDYTFSPGIWMNRYMNVGDQIDMRANQETSYDASCNVTVHRQFGYINTLEKHASLDFGGDIGVQDVIVLKYDYGSGGFERFYYSDQWGWVKWELYTAAGALVQTSIFNKIAGAPIRPGPGCFP